MQLATSQRPHPPPVPPRPSRHVVAEALKRTPRPPCPTRQAPPPPKTRPWRLEDHETAAGRTVVYESARGEEEQTNGEQVRCSSEPRSLNELQRPLASLRCCNDETLAYGSGNNITGNTAAAVGEKTEQLDGGTNTRAASERNEAENQRERHQQRQSLMKNRRSISDDNILAHNQTDYSERKNDARAGAKYYEFREEEKRRVLDKLMSRIGDEYSDISEHEDKLLLNGYANEDIAKLDQAKRTEIRNEDDGTFQRRSSAFVEKAYFQGEVTVGTRLSTTPTKLEMKLNDNDHNDRDKVATGDSKPDEEATSRQAEEETLSAADPSGSTTTISSDDGATVVVIEEPERKIAFNDDNDNIYHQDWLEAGIRYSSTKITLPGDEPIDRADEIASIDDNRDNGDDERPTYTKLDYASLRERISMSSLQGLPPLPRSLSGFNLSEGRRESAEPPPPPARSSSKTQKNVKSTQPSSSRPSPPGRQLTTLDTQLAILRKEMFGLRQLDLSLLSQLWSLNESIQEFRQLLQEQEDRAPSPSPSSEEGDDNSYGSHPPPPPRRPAPLLHHHRPPRPPRPLRPPANDESPSSEEYGAV